MPDGIQRQNNRCHRRGAGHRQVLVNNAMPLFKGIDGCTYEEFAYAQAVGVTAPFYLAKLFKDAILSQKVERKPVRLFCIRIHRASRR